MWSPEKRFVYVAPCHTSGLSPRSMIPSVMAPGQSVDLTPGGRVGERGSWKNRFKPFLFTRSRFPIIQLWTNARYKTAYRRDLCMSCTTSLSPFAILRTTKAQLIVGTTCNSRSFFACIPPNSRRHPTTQQ